MKKDALLARAAGIPGVPERAIWILNVNPVFELTVFPPLAVFLHGSAGLEVKRQHSND